MSWGVGLTLVAAVGVLLAGAIPWPWRLAPPPFAAGVALGRSLDDPALGELKKAGEVWKRTRGPVRRVVDVVALVPDEATFLEAIKVWDDGHYFPILIDEPELTLAFLRAFQPTRVIRFPGAVAPLRADSRWEAAEQAVAQAWTFTARTGPASKAPKFSKRTTPGVVLSRAESPLLCAGVALAAGRFQPLLPWDLAGPADRVLTQQEARQAANQFEVQVADHFETFGNLGDGCDFATLAADWPYLYEVKEEPAAGLYAFDDLLAREPGTGRRWAYVGRLLGDAPQGVYQAMCSLFLQPRAASLFNSYGKSGEDWTAFRTALAKDRLAPVMPTDSRDGPDQADHKGWLSLFGPRNLAGLVMVNTSGGSKIFNLQRGQSGHTDDVPMTDPAAVVFIHSYSAANPYDQSTLAGRWLSQGAFAYYGSVNEPFLTAFRSPELVADLFVRGIPLAAAVRRIPPESFGQPWRLIYVGDPFYHLEDEATERMQWLGVEGWPALPAEDDRSEPPPDKPTSFVRLYETALAAAASQPGPLNDRLWARIQRTPRPTLDQTNKCRLDALVADQFSRLGEWARLIEYLERIPRAERTSRHERWLGTARKRVSP